MDLDNLWSYMKTYGNTGWEDCPTYFDILIPYVLDVLDRLNLKITFFIVGQDAAQDKNNDVLKLLTERGHEVGNHSFHHEPWLHMHLKDRIEQEILETEEQIIRVTGHKPIGFRGPGFSWSLDLLEVLAEKDYVYDATTFPTYLVPLATAYYFCNSNLNAEEKNKRKEIRGGLREGMRPIKPYCWKLASGRRLLEIPVTTIPIIKTPFHLSYLIFLSQFSSNIMLLYLKMALALCRLTGTEPSFVIHPTDLLGGDQVPGMRFFPGMDLSAHRKLEIFKRVIKELSRHFTLVNMRFHAESILQRNNISIKCP
ncbi:MAG: polysaccharide deacetylase [Desulfobulbaceae bacterium C00003063]|nr:MAG: polysaccharide deacetylase [Desulfobulbaceae bacterium C00003063]